MLIRILAKNLHARRRQAGLSQEELAEMAGVSRETIHRLEHGEINPHVETVGKLADALQLSVSALLAERASDELTELVLRLPSREQENMVVMLRALSDHLGDGGR